MDSANITMVPVSDLHFDAFNPRLVEFGLDKSAGESDILTTLWESMDVMELVQSIAASGYFPHEPVIVAEENGKNVVIEGNRRLAAVKVLLNPGIAKSNGWQLPAIDAKRQDSLKSLPVIVSTREEAWRYLGFKHVNGPAKWTGLAKAKYIAEVHKNYGVTLDDIASQIGDRHRTVKRLYRGLMVLEQAERTETFDSNRRYASRLAFSHLYTGIELDGFKTFLGIADVPPDSSDPVPTDRLEQLGEVCLWLFGDGKAKVLPVVKTQNPDLRKLDAILKSKEATSSLRAQQNLTAAFELTQPPSQQFGEALLAAKRELRKAQGYVSTGYDRSEEWLRTAGSVTKMAEDLYDLMEELMQRQSGNSEKKSRLVEE